jgi:hypothetical protein
MTDKVRFSAPSWVLNAKAGDFVRYKGPDYSHFFKVHAPVPGRVYKIKSIEKSKVLLSGIAVVVEGLPETGICPRGLEPVTPQSRTKEAMEGLRKLLDAPVAPHAPKRKKERVGD